MPYAQHLLIAGLKRYPRWIGRRLRGQKTLTASLVQGPLNQVEDEMHQLENEADNGGCHEHRRAICIVLPLLSVFHNLRVFRHVCDGHLILDAMIVVHEAVEARVQTARIRHGISK